MTRYTYDDEGRRTLVETENTFTGRIERTATAYDDDGRLATREFERRSTDFDSLLERYTETYAWVDCP